MEKQAKLVELNDFRSPANGEVFYYTVKDSTKIRVAIWNKNALNGTIILQSGRTEFIEKYYEVIQEIINRNYCVAMFDWRGQGLSDRLTSNKYLGHVNKFQDYDLDLHEIFIEIFSKSCPQPFIGMAHSMGGSIMASYASKKDTPLIGLILCAPMLNIPIPKIMKFIIQIVGFFSWLGFRDLPLSRPEWNKKRGWHEISFNENNVTSDENRYTRTSNLIKKEDNLALGGLSIGWSHSAYLRTNSHNKKWAKSIKIPTLVLCAMKDQLINSQLTIELCSNIPNHTIIEIQGEHELLMEKDNIRKECWEKIDNFLQKL